MIKKHHYVDSPLYKLESTARACNRHFSLLFKKLFSDIGITEGELRLIDTVVRSPEISQIELARLLFKGRAHVTQMLNSLESRGIITRIDEIKCGHRIRKTVLTPKGRDIYETICQVFENRLEKMCKFFESKEDELIEMLDEIKNVITGGEEVDFN